MWEIPPKLPLSPGESGPLLIHGSWTHPSLHPKWHLGWFSHFWYSSRLRPKDRETHSPCYFCNNRPHLMLCIAMRSTKKLNVSRHLRFKSRLLCFRPSNTDKALCFLVVRPSVRAYVHTYARASMPGWRHCRLEIYRCFPLLQAKWYKVALLILAHPLWGPVCY